MLHREATEQNNSNRCHSAVILSVWMIIYVFYRHFLKMASPSIPALALLLWSYTKGNNGVAEESFSFKKSFSILGSSGIVVGQKQQTRCASEQEEKEVMRTK